MLTFHDTLETFFRKNFQEEIQRLAVDTHPRDGFIANRPMQATGTSLQHNVLSDQFSINNSLQESTTSTRQPHALASPLDLRRTASTAASISPHPRENGQLSAESVLPPRQTPLQRGLAHLARHGVNGVASGPRDTINSDIDDNSSPHNSFINGSSAPIPNLSGAVSINNSLGSIGSLRGRFSKFGSLNFGRRDG